MTDSPQSDPGKRLRSDYVRKLLREIGVSTKLGGAGLLGLSATEAFNSSEVADRLQSGPLLLMAVSGIILAVAGVLFTAEAER